jgi:hypothetical protein
MEMAAVDGAVGLAFDAEYSTRFEPMMFLLAGRGTVLQVGRMIPPSSGVLDATGDPIQLFLFGLSHDSTRARPRFLQVCRSQHSERGFPLTLLYLLHADPFPAAPGKQHSLLSSNLFPLED